MRSSERIRGRKDHHRLRSYAWMLLLLSGCAAGGEQSELPPQDRAPTGPGASIVATPSSTTDGSAASPAQARESLLCGLRRPGERGLLVAGSGSNIELIRTIARRYEAAHPGSSIVVPPSIGSSGAIRAILDDAIDLGLVSRPLRPRELQRGLHNEPLASVPVVLATSAELTQERIELEDMLALLQERSFGPSGGPPLVPLLREQGDSSNRVLRKALPGFAEALDRAYAHGRWRICYTDQEMILALLQTPGAAGLVDLGTLRLGPGANRLRPLAIGPGDAGPAGLRSGSYGFGKQLGFVTRGAPAGEAARFIEFSRSTRVDDLLQRGGYLRSVASAGQGG